MTGIYPCDPLKYPTDRFDKQVMLKFTNWINAGRPAARSIFEENNDNDLPVTENNVDFVIDEQLPSTSEHQELPSTSTQTPFMATSISTPVIQPAEIDELVIPPIPYPAPPGFRWKVRLELERIDAPNLLSNKSFEEVILSVAKPPKETSKKSRKRLGFNTNVVTDKEFLAAMEKKKEDLRLKEEKKEERRIARLLKEEKKTPIIPTKNAKKSNGKGFRKNLSQIVSEPSSEEEIAEVQDNDGEVEYDDTSEDDDDQS